MEGSASEAGEVQDTGCFGVDLAGAGMEMGGWRHAETHRGRDKERQRETQRQRSTQRDIMTQ